MQTKNETIQKALDRIHEYDPERWERMNAVDWWILTGPRDAGEQWFFDISDGISNHHDNTIVLNMLNIPNSAAFNGVEQMDFMASVIVHEFAHLENEDFSELSSIEAEKEFAAKLPDGGKLREYLDLQATYLTASGRWDFPGFR